LKIAIGALVLVDADDLVNMFIMTVMGNRVSAIVFLLLLDDRDDSRCTKA
jgi:hypothetical protein